MFNLLTRFLTIFGYRRRNFVQTQHYSDPEHSLTSIIFDLHVQIDRLGPRRMINRQLRDRLRSLTQEDRTFLVDHPDTFGITPLTRACAKGLSRVVNYLCRTCSPDLTKLNKWRNPRNSLEERMAPALWHAVVANQLCTVKVLLEAGADINGVSDTGSTAINSACFLGRTKIFFHLLKAGADINIPNNNGGTCLMNSIYKGSIFTKLIFHGADIYARDNFQKTVLHYAIEEGVSDAVTYLLTNDFNRFHVNNKERRDVLITGALVGGHMLEALTSILVEQMDDVYHDAIDIFGCVGSRAVKFNVVDTWLLATKSRRKFNLSKTINLPIAHFNNQLECITEQQLMDLKTDEDIMYQVMLMYLRVLGPNHQYLFNTFKVIMKEYDEIDRAIANRVGFLFLKLQIEVHGLLHENCAKISGALMKHCCELMSSELPINFEIAFDTLKLMHEQVMTSKDGVEQLSNEKQIFFDWALNFIVSLLFVIIKIIKNQDKEDFYKYIGRTLLANGCQKAQLRTVKQGYTLLHLSVSQCNPLALDEHDIFPSLDVAEVLLACGAPVNVSTLDGSSPLFVAVGSSHYKKEIVELLLRYGAHYDQVGPGGDSAIEVLKRCLKQSKGFLQPPENFPGVRSLSCLSAMAVGKIGVDIHSDYIPYFLKDVVKLHARVLNIQ